MCVGVCVCVWGGGVSPKKDQNNIFISTIFRMKGLRVATFIRISNNMTSNSFLKKACPDSAFFFKKLTNSIFYARTM